MGDRGPAPLPLKFLKGRGTYRPDRHAATPEAPRGAPAMPVEYGMYPIERRIWGKVCAQLDQLGVLSSVDEQVIFRYVSTFVSWLIYRRYGRECGETYSHVTDRGEVVPRLRPEALRMSDLEKSLDRLEKQLGLSPSARRGLVSGEERPTGGDEDGLHKRRS